MEVAQPRPAEANKLFKEALDVSAKAGELSDQVEEKRLLKVSIDLLQQALQLAPQDGEIILMLGNQHLRLEDEEKAFELYDAAIPLLRGRTSDEILVFALIRRSALILRRGEVKEAWLSSSEALKLDPANAEADELKSLCETLMSPE